MAEFPVGLTQPDQRSCGAACLVVAHALGDAGYARLVESREGFRAEVLAMHRRVTSPADVAGRLQVPWPQSLGTPPWAVARQLQGTTGVPHRVRPIRWRDPEATYDDLAGRPLPVALYVGSTWLPRHVVLLLDGSGSRLRVYEPSHGQVVDVDRRAVVGHRLGLAGWDVPWFTVLPER